jgi:mRNA-degrading endonuclease RelE of RelBE toxin-antitoxin system
MLKGSRTGYFRIRKGDRRIVFSLVKSEILQIIVNDIGFRGNIYK